jgi:hypothetical protein
VRFLLEFVRLLMLLLKGNNAELTA